MGDNKVTIVYHSAEYGELWVESDRTTYQYAYVPVSVVKRLRKLVKAGADGSAWQILRKLKVRRQG